MADLTPEQQQLLGVAAGRMKAVQQPVELTPEQISILAGAKQRMASQTPANNPLAMPDYVNQQPDAATTAQYVNAARDDRIANANIPEDTNPATADAMRTIRKYKQEQANQPGKVSGVDDLVRSFSRGTLGVGSYLDEANAGLNALAAPYVDPLIPDKWGMQKLPEQNLGDRYDHALSIQRQKDAQMDKDHPVVSTAAKLLGGVTTAGGLIKQAPVVGNLMLGNIEAALPWKMAASAATNGTLGAIQGFGAGEGGTKNRLKESGLEAALGGSIGAIAPAVATGGNKLISWITDKILNPGEDALSSVSPEARKYVVKELADPDKLAAIQKKLTDLGPDAMLADVSPDWLGVARGAATRPGARSSVVDPLNERAAMANTRLRTDVANNLGADPIPSSIEQGLDASRNEVGRQYGPVMSEQSPYDFTPVTDDLDRQIGTLRGDAQRALQRVRGMLNDHGVTDVNGEPQVTASPSVAFQTRQAIDGMLKTENNPKVINALSDARQMIDDSLNASIPRLKEVDSQYHELARQSEGLNQGRPILSNEANAMRPSELQDALVAGAEPQGRFVGPSAEAARMKQGTLGEIYRAIGTKSNDTTALRNIVRGEGDWNRDKLAMLFGQEPADNALKAIDRETVFGDTANRVTRGSDTAMASRFGKFLDETGTPRDVPMDTTMLGVGRKVAQKIARTILQGNPDANAANMADQLGKLSVANGDVRDRIIDAILNRGQRNVVDMQRAAALENILKSGGLASYPMLPGVRK